MEKQKAIALKNFVLEAENFLISIIDSKIAYSSDEIMAFKQKYSSVEFKKFQVDFEGELVANLLKYPNYEIIKIYLKSVFDNYLRNLSFEVKITYDIIETNFETEFLLKLF